MESKEPDKLSPKRPREQASEQTHQPRKHRKIEIRRSKFLKGKMPNGETIVFEENIVKGDGHCGFTAIGATREDVASTLLLSENSGAREFLCEEIRSVFQNDELAPSTPDEWQRLYQIYSDKEALRNQKSSQIVREIGALQENPDLTVKKPMKFIQQYASDEQKQEISQFDLAAFQAEDALNRYCKSPEVFSYYIKAYRGNLWLGYKSALLYAEAKNISLYVWRKDELYQKKLVLIDHYNAGEASINTVHIIYTGRFTHFNLLSIPSFTDDMENEPSSTASMHHNNNPQIYGNIPHTLLNSALDKLPDEMLVLILKYLNKTDLYQLKYTSTFFRELISHQLINEALYPPLNYNSFIKKSFYDTSSRIQSLLTIDKNLIVGYTNGTIEIWDGNEERSIYQESNAHNYTVTKLILLSSSSENKKLIASASSDSTINIWELREGTLEKMKQLGLPDDRTPLPSKLYALIEHHDILISGSENGNVDLWPWKEASPRRKRISLRNRKFNLPNNIEIKSLLSVGNLLAVGCNDGKIYLLDVENEEIKRTLDSYSSKPVYSLAKIDEKTIAGGHTYGLVNVWQIEEINELIVTSLIHQFSTNGGGGGGIFNDLVVRIEQVPLVSVSTEPMRERGVVPLLIGASSKINGGLHKLDTDQRQTCKITDAPTEIQSFVSLGPTRFVSGEAFQSDSLPNGSGKITFWQTSTADNMRGGAETGSSPPAMENDEEGEAPLMDRRCSL